MKNLTEKTVFLNQIGVGHYEVELIRDFETIGSFTTTDMQIVEDIKEMNSYIGGTGFESNLTHFENFEEVLEFVESRVND
jgi:hypothetical protein